MVLQRPVLLRRSVGANLDFVLKRQGLARQARSERIQELLAEGGLQDKARQSARSLSVGEGQRLAVLRALAMRPEILFLDEPTSALDPGATQKIETLIRRASARGTKILMVTHDIGQARRLGGDIVLMWGGQVAEQRAAHGFFEAPESQEAQAFLGGALTL
jgi:tungstate transport system ATP-binding protein